MELLTSAESIVQEESTLDLAAPLAASAVTPGLPDNATEDWVHACFFASRLSSPVLLVKLSFTSQTQFY